MASVPTLAILSDTHVPVTARLTRAISRMDIDALLFAGDHHPTRFGVTRRSAAAWRRSVGRPLNDAVIAVPGNHDYSPEDGLAEWRERFMAWWPSGVSRIDGPGCFLADLGYLRIIGLDTGETASHLSDDQLAWLRALSTDVVRGPAIALAHSPLFPVGVHIGRSLDADAERRDAVLHELARLGVLAYFCGHEHLLAHRRLSSAKAPDHTIHQLTVGGGGATGEQPASADLEFSASINHVGLIDVGYGDRVTFRAIDVEERHVWSLELNAARHRARMAPHHVMVANGLTPEPGRPAPVQAEVPPSIPEPPVSPPRPAGIRRVVTFRPGSPTLTVARPPAPERRWQRTSPASVSSGSESRHDPVYP